MHIDRRTAMKWVLAAGVAARSPDFVLAATPADRIAPIGYGKDPNLMKPYTPGELWPLTLNDTQKAATRALCDLIIPADERSPAASAVAVHEFIDEWISAPYRDCQRDREMLTSGLIWLDTESQRRFAGGFAAVTPEQASRICDDICGRTQTAAHLAQPAAFFSRFRDLTAIGYYTTPVGMKTLGYVGNEPLVKFDGPPPEVLERLGLE